MVCGGCESKGDTRSSGAPSFLPLALTDTLTLSVTLSLSLSFSLSLYPSLSVVLSTLYIYICTYMYILFLFVKNKLLQNSEGNFSERLLWQILKGFPGDVWLFSSLTNRGNLLENPQQLQTTIHCKISFLTIYGPDFGLPALIIGGPADKGWLPNFYGNVFVKPQCGALQDGYAQGLRFKVPFVAVPPVSDSHPPNLQNRFSLHFPVEERLLNFRVSGPVLHFQRKTEQKCKI